MGTHRTLRLATATSLWLAVATLQAAAQNLIPNPDFSQGNNDFITGYTENSNNFDPGTFSIGANPNKTNSNWSSAIHPHSGNTMMMFNGATDADTIAWLTPPIPVKPHTTYFFTAYATSIFPVSPPILIFRIDGLQVGGTEELSHPPGQWSQFCIIWNAGKNTTAMISIVDQNTDAYGNDFALDDLTLGTGFSNTSQPSDNANCQPLDISLNNKPNPTA